MSITPNLLFAVYIYIYTYVYIYISMYEYKDFHEYIFINNIRREIEIDK